MAGNRWTEWPTREALSRIGIPKARIALDMALLLGLAGWAVYSSYASGAFHGWSAVLPPLGLAGCAVARRADDP